MKIYSNAPEDVQYKLWKDGYVNSCPAERLIKEIASENLETTDFIKQEFGENLPNTEAYCQSHLKSKRVIENCNGLVYESCHF